jgi:hypothetical protein
MKDLRNRNGLEGQIADGIEKEFGRFARQLSKLIPGLDSAADAIPYEEWVAHSDKLNGVIAPLINNVYMQRSGEIIDALGFTSVDWGLVDTNAADWARRYAAELVRNISDTSRAKITQLIPQYFEQQWTQGQLTEQIMGANGSFSRTRAEMIARTEVTNAASQGAQQTAAELARQGIVMVPIWNTRHDEIVSRCPICAPRHGKVIENNEFPPGHPRCRCWVTYEYQKAE